MGGTSTKGRNLLITCCILSVLPLVVLGDCICDSDAGNFDTSKALKYKIGAIIALLVGSAMGIYIPLLGKAVPALRPERDVFFIIKTFAAGVILATGFVHVLPEAFDSLTSPCLSADPWAKYPFTGIIAMIASICTLLVDASAMSYFSSKTAKTHSVEPHGGIEDGEAGGGCDSGGDFSQTADHAQPIHAHYGHTHGSPDSSQLLRHRVTSQVLELGIIVHSVIIGITLGASRDPSSVRSLIAALTFHQFFEGMGLGGTIAQAKFNTRAIIIMVMFFSLTTPVGVAIGIGISNVYDESSPTALIVQGMFDAASSGILIYMALVNLLAVDFMSAKLQNNFGLRVKATVSLLLGAGCMSLMAKWA